MYGLRQSPKHWYDKIDGILRSMGLQKNIYDPCLYTGFIKDLEDPSNTATLIPMTLGLYVNDFVIFSTCDAVEEKFQEILSRLITVDFMGIVEWFLGDHFSWRMSQGEVNIHMNQSGFSRNPVESFELQHRSQTPLSTPYCSGMPIDAIAVADKDNESPAQKPCTAAYQSLVVSVGWLCNNTRPDLSVVHSFLSSYLMHPVAGHTKAALYVLQYIRSMHDFGISSRPATRNPSTCISINQIPPMSKRSLTPSLLRKTERTTSQHIATPAGIRKLAMPFPQYCHPTLQVQKHDRYHLIPYGGSHIMESHPPRTNIPQLV